MLSLLFSIIVASAYVLLRGCTFDASKASKKVRDHVTCCKSLSLSLIIINSNEQSIGRLVESVLVP